MKIEFFDNAGGGDFFLIFLAAPREIFSRKVTKIAKEEKEILNIRLLGRLRVWIRSLVCDIIFREFKKELKDLVANP